MTKQLLQRICDELKADNERLADLNNPESAGLTPDWFGGLWHAMAKLEAEIARLPDEPEVAQDMATWANLVIQELRIDTPRGNWDQLDKLEDAVAAFTAAVEPTSSPSYDDETSRQLWTEDADGKPRRDPV